MLVNKWIQFAMSAGIAVSAVAVTFDWSSVVSAGTAGKIIGVLGVVKMVLNALQPATGVTAIATGNSIVTHG